MNIEVNNNLIAIITGDTSVDGHSIFTLTLPAQSTAGQMTIHALNDAVLHRQNTAVMTISCCSSTEYFNISLGVPSISYRTRFQHRL